MDRKVNLTESFATESLCKIDIVCDTTIIFSGNSGYDQMNQIHDYSQNYAPPQSQSGYNTNGYSQYPQQSYPQTSEYDQGQGYSQDYK